MSACGFSARWALLASSTARPLPLPRPEQTPSAETKLTVSAVVLTCSPLAACSTTQLLLALGLHSAQHYIRLTRLRVAPVLDAGIGR